MIYRIKFLNLVLLGLLIAGSAAAQVIPSRPPRTIDPNRPDPATQRWYDELRKRENAPTGIGSVRESNETLIARLTNEARKKLAPADEERGLYEEFLKQPKTGLVRLAAETDCARILDIAHPNNECLNYYLPGKARAYSFRNTDYSHQAYADVQRTKSMFVSPGTFVLGLIASLGDVPIETVSLQHESVSELLRFMPASEINGVTQQEIALTKGLAMGNLTYRKAVPIEENTTYLIRSIAYKANFLNLPKSEKPRGSLNTDDRLDIVVVFRVVRRDLFDNFLLLWKEISRKDSPLLEVDMSK